MRPSGILIGTAGVYHVASQLAARGFHAAVTYGNAPHVDILAGLVDGAASVSLQVKTAWLAQRTRGRGQDKALHHYEWDVGRKSATLKRPDLFFAFVDLRALSASPDVFIVPSEFVHGCFQYATAKYFGGVEDKVKRWRFHPNIADMERFKNNWDPLEHYLSGKAPPAGQIDASSTA